MPTDSTLKAEKSTWMSDIQSFNECGDDNKNRYESKLLADPGVQRKQVAFNQALKKSKQDEVEEKQASEKEMDTSNEIKATTNIAMSQVEKEMKFETLALREEIMREKHEQTQL